MSIVAVKVLENTIEIASDSITVRGWTQSKSNNSFSKLVQVNGMTIGGTGGAEESALLYVYCSTRRPEQPTEGSIINFFSEFASWKNEKTNSSAVGNDYIFIFDGHAFSVESFFVQEITDFCAVGAGMDFALAALHLGHDVVKAVEVACELSVYCELPVKKFVIPR